MHKWLHSNQAVVLLRRKGKPGCFERSAFRSTALLVSQVRPVCWSVKNKNSVVIKATFGSFGSVLGCHVLLENETSFSIKLVSRIEH